MTRCSLRRLGPAVNREMAKIKPAGPRYYSGSTAASAIDALAMILTGERDYFTLGPQAHAAQGSQTESGERSKWPCGDW